MHIVHRFKLHKLKNFDVFGWTFELEQYANYFRFCSLRKPIYRMRPRSSKPFECWYRSSRSYTAHLIIRFWCLPLLVRHAAHIVGSSLNTTHRRCCSIADDQKWISDLYPIYSSSTYSIPGSAEERMQKRSAISNTFARKPHDERPLPAALYLLHWQTLRMAAISVYSNSNGFSYAFPLLAHKKWSKGSKTVWSSNGPTIDESHVAHTGISMFKHFEVHSDDAASRMRLPPVNSGHLRAVGGELQGAQEADLPAVFASNQFAEL